jgi:putative transposase
MSSFKAVNGEIFQETCRLGQPSIPNERNWRNDGTWLKIHDRLRSWLRTAQERPSSPSQGIIDSQSVATTTMVHDAVGFDKAKHIKGRKRHTAVDTLGLVLRVVVTAASVPERVGGQQVLQKVHQMGDAVSRLYLIWVDGGYSGNPFLQWAMDMFGWVIQVVLRPEQTKGFVVLKKRWVVERTFGWLNWSRRLSEDYGATRFSETNSSWRMESKEHCF